MARSNLAGLAWSMEDEEIIAELGEGGGGEVTEDLAGTETPEAAIIEVDEASDAVEETEDKIEELENDAESLESIFMAMEGFKRNGGMTKDVALVAQIGIENIIAKYPSLSLRGVGQPSIESFGSSGGRLSATVTSCEGIRQLLSDFWAMIMKQVNKLTAYIRNWYLKVLDAAPRLKKRAEAISQKAGNTVGAIDQKKIDISVLKDLSFGGKPIQPGALATQLGKLKDACENILQAKTADAYETSMNAYLDIMEKAVEGKLSTEGYTYSIEVDLVNHDRNARQEAARKAANQGPQLPAEEAKKVEKTLSDMINVSEKGLEAPNASNVTDASKRFPEGVTVKGTPEIIGNTIIIVKTGKDPKQIKNYATNTGLSLDKKDLKKTVESSGQFETMTTSQVSTVADIVAAICTQVMDYKKSWEGREKQQKRMDSEVKKAIASSEKSTEENSSVIAKQVRECGGAVKEIWQKGIQFESNLINFAIKTSRSALTYCERSLSEHKK